MSQGPSIGSEPAVVALAKGPKRGNNLEAVVLIIIEMSKITND